MGFPQTIYAIKHKITKRIYIGSTSKDVGKRCIQHMYKLRNNKHSSELMQSDFNEFGEQYDFYKLGTIENITETYKEYEEMVKHNTLDPRYGYNQGDAKRCRAIIRDLVRPPLEIKEDLSDLDDHEGANL